MSEQKRKANETDPDYDDVVDQQAKRQRVLEQDGRQAACKTINSIIKKEFQKEISDKEKALQQIDLHLNQARMMMDRLRACVVASYYGRANRTVSSGPTTSNFSSLKAPPPNIHPTVKKYIGKAPKGQQQQGEDGTLSQDVESSQNQGKVTTPNVNESSTKAVPRLADVSRVPSSTTSSSQLPFTSLKSSKPTVSAQYDDRRLRFKIKKKIVIGNVSRYIPVDQREAIDMSSHKWMVYVRGPKSEPNISGFVKKVWFFLHHSYKPNDHVEISEPPFHLTRRGWGEFPVRVQLHFVDARNKKVDIIHHLKLDKTFTGLQKLGAETVVEVELEKDFFESDNDDSPAISTGPSHLFVPSQPSSSGSSTLLKRPQGVIPALLKSSSSAFEKPKVTSTSSSSTQSLNKTIKSNSNCQVVGDIERDCVNNSGMDGLVEGELQSKGEERIDKEAKSDAKRKHTNAETCLTGDTVSVVNRLDESSYPTDIKEEVVEEMVWDENLLTCDNNSLNQIEVCDSLKQEMDVGTYSLHDSSHEGEEDYHVTIEHEGLDVSDGLKGHGAKAEAVDSTYVEGCGERKIEVDGTIESEITILTERKGENYVVNYQEDGQNIVSTQEKEIGNSTFVSGQVDTSSPKNYIPDLTSSTDKGSLSEESNIHQPVLKQNRSFSLLTSSTLEKVRQQKQTQQHPSPLIDIKLNPPLRRQVSAFQSGAMQQEYAVSTSQSVSNAVGVKQQFTIVNIADLHKKKTVLPATSFAPPTMKTSVSISCNSENRSNTLSQAKSSLPVLASKGGEFPSQSINVVSLEGKQQKEYIVQLPSTAVMGHKGALQKSLLVGHQLTKYKEGENTKTSLSQQSNDCNTQSSQKIIYLNSPASCQRKSSSLISPSITTNKKQVSLLSGLVVNTSTNQNAGHPQILSNQNVSLSVNSNSSSHLQAISNNVQTIDNSLKLSKDNKGVIVLSRTNNTPHQIVVNRNTNSSSHCLPHQPFAPTKSSSAFSILTPPDPSSSLSSSISTTPNTVLAQTSQPNIVIAYPNTILKPGQHISSSSLSSSSNTFDASDSLSGKSEIKMSVIGRTKRAHQQQLQQRSIRPPDSVTMPLSSQDTPEERIRKQYEVLNAWKNNPLLYDKVPLTRKVYSYVNDEIDGEVDVIPKLNVEDYPDLISLMKAAIKLHPLVQTGVNKLTHPYCAESLDQWWSWPVGKQRAAEWHRACFTLKYVKTYLGGAMSFKGENLFKTRQLVQWCRLHAFSPQGPVSTHQVLQAMEEPNVKCEQDPNTKSGCSNSHASNNLLWSARHLPQSLTKVANLEACLSVGSQPLDTGADTEEIEIVFEEKPMTNRLHVKEEMVKEEEKTVVSNWSPESDGALFVYDWMRKRGIKFLPGDVKENIAATDVLFGVMMEFASDVLRKSFSVYSHRKRCSEALGVEDVHEALSSLPAAAFCCNTYLGKEEEDSTGAGNVSR